MDSVIRAEFNPMFGITQPNNGIDASLWSVSMAKESKQEATNELLDLRAALASNLRAYVTVKYGPDAADTTVAEDIQRKIGVGKNTVLRALGVAKSDSDLRLDTLVKLASYFGTSASALLQDHHRSARKGQRKARATEDSGPSVKGVLHRRPG